MTRKISTWLVLFFITWTATAQAAGAQRQLLTPMRPGQAAPDFDLQDMDGNRQKLSDYRGKVVIVNFWATWCPPCREEMPSMQRAWKKVKEQNVVLLGVNVGEDEDTIFSFTANYPVEFPLPMDVDGKVVKQWPVRGLPSTYVVDRQGNLAYQAIGGRAWDSDEILAPILELARPRLP